MRETVLHAHLAARGAEHVPDGDLLLPRCFADPAVEYAALPDGVELVEPPEPLAMIGLDGPAAAGLLGEPAASLGPYAHAIVRVGGIALRAQRASPVRGPGFVLQVPAAGAPAVWDALAGAGARP